MIQKYENGYAIAFTDHRTLLSAKYGVYKIEGVVVSNEEAALNNTDSDFASAKGKTTMENVKVYASTTSNTTTGEYEEVKGQVVFNVSHHCRHAGQDRDHVRQEDHRSLQLHRAGRVPR